MTFRSPCVGQFFCASLPSMIFSTRGRWLGSDSSRFFFLTPARHRVRLDDRFGLGLRLGPSGLEFLAVVERQPRLIRTGRMRFSLRWPLTNWLSSFRSFSISTASSSIFCSCDAMVAACVRMVALALQNAWQPANRWECPCGSLMLRTITRSSKCARGGHTPESTRIPENIFRA